MAVVLGGLGVGFVLMGGAGGGAERLSGYAICSFKNGYEGESGGKPLAEIVVQILLLGYGFFVRVVRLSVTLSVQVFGRGRAYLSCRYRHLLFSFYEYLSISCGLGEGKVVGVLSPFVVVFLGARVYLDIAVSMLSEVCRSFIFIVMLLLLLVSST